MNARTVLAGTVVLLGLMLALFSIFAGVLMP